MKPSVSKIVQLVVSIGEHDTERSIDDFVVNVRKSIISSLGDTVKVTMLYGEYQHNGKRYKQTEWEKWDGSEGNIPNDIYTESNKPILVPRAVNQKDLTAEDVAKAVDFHREALGLSPRVIASTEASRPVESISAPSEWLRVPE